MVIKRLDRACFKINAKNPHGEDSLIITEPCSLAGKLKKSLVNSAHIITFSHPCEQLKELIKNDAKNQSKYPFIIKSPGEYEINNVFIFGLPYWPPSQKNKGSQEQEKNKNLPERNIIYMFKAEGITLTHLGQLKQKELNSQQLEYIENTDILLIPLYSQEQQGITPKLAANIVSQIEPRIIIPMQYEDNNKSKLIQNFVKEMGNSKEELDKLKITKKDLPQEETKLIILKSA